MIRTFCTLVFIWLVSTASAPAEVTVGVRVGPSAIVVGPDGVRGRIVLGPRANRQRRKNRTRHSDGYRKPRQVIIVRERERDIEPRPEPEPEPNPQPVVTDPGLPTTSPEPAKPLDPSGHARIARAPAFARAPFGVGDVLPSGTPHVTLDPVRFDLPRPPEGEIYARVRGQVYRIAQITRQITAIVVR